MVRFDLCNWRAKGINEELILTKKIVEKLEPSDDTFPLEPGNGPTTPSQESSRGPCLRPGSR